MMENNSPFVNQYSETQICSHIRELHRRHNGNATPENLDDEDDLVETSIVMDTFGTWENALVQAGLEAETH